MAENNSKMEANYIVIEGGDGSGKSTQAELLLGFFNEKGIPCVQTREPGSTKEGEKIREILLNKDNDLDPLTELFLFEAARREYFKQDVLPRLREGTSVIADRSGYSTEAYQGYAGRVDLRLIRQLNDLATFSTRPNLAFIIDVEAKKGLSKEEEADRFAAKGREYHEKVNRGYLEIAKANPDNTIVIPYRDEDVEGMQAEIRRHVQERLKI